MGHASLVRGVHVICTIHRHGPCARLLYVLLARLVEGALEIDRYKIYLDR